MPVCALQHQINDGEGGEGGDSIIGRIPIAGDLADHGGKALDFEVQQLKGEDGADKDSAKKKGLRLILKGGVRDKTPQKAIVDFLCDDKRLGTEDEWESEDKYESAAERRDDGGDKEKPPPPKETQLIKGDNAALRFVSYAAEKGDDKTEVLKLTWYTSLVCQSSTDVPDPDEDEGSSSSHWGFFTWLFVL